MANFFNQLVQRAQGAIPVAQPLIVPRFAPSMAIAGDFLEFSTFEPSSLGQKTKIDLDRKPDTLYPEKELTVTPDIVELMPSLPPGHWSANRSRLHQIQTLEPFEPFEFNDFEEGRRQEAEGRRELVENTSISASDAPENPSTRSPVTDKLPPTSAEATPTVFPSFRTSEAPESQINRSPLTDNLPPSSQPAAATHSPETELPSQAVEKGRRQERCDPASATDARECAPREAEGRRELVENTSFLASDAPENHSTRSPVTDDLPPSSQPAAATHSPETELPSQGDHSPSKQQVNRGASIPPPQLMPQVENTSFSASNVPEDRSTRSPLTENLPSTSQQPAATHSPETELSSQADNYPSKQPNNLKPTIFPQKPQPQVKSKSSEDRSLSQSIPPLNNSERSSLVQKPYKVSTQPIQEVSRSNQFSSKLNNSRSQPSKEPIKNSSTTSPQTPGRQKAIGYTQQNIQETVPRSPFPISDNVKKSHIYPQQQLSSASGSRKTALVKPLVDRANTQHSQSSTNLDSTEVPPKKIEINIGRIIVRAADRPPTPPKSSHRRSKPKKPALSLSDYLKQRRSEDKGG